jgi:hypothetical protein
MPHQNASKAPLCEKRASFKADNAATHISLRNLPLVCYESEANIMLNAKISFAGMATLIKCEIFADFMIFILTSQRWHEKNRAGKQGKKKKLTSQL